VSEHRRSAAVLSRDGSNASSSPMYRNTQNVYFSIRELAQHLPLARAEFSAGAMDAELRTRIAVLLRSPG